MQADEAAPSICDVVHSYRTGGWTLRTGHESTLASTPMLKAGVTAGTCFKSGFTEALGDMTLVLPAAPPPDPKQSLGQAAAAAAAPAAAAPAAAAAGGDGGIHPPQVTIGLHRKPGTKERQSVPAVPPNSTVLHFLKEGEEKPAYLPSVACRQAAFDKKHEAKVLAAEAKLGGLGLVQGDCPNKGGYGIPNGAWKLELPVLGNLTFWAYTKPPFPSRTTLGEADSFKGEDAMLDELHVEEEKSRSRIHTTKQRPQNVRRSSLPSRPTNQVEKEALKKMRAAEKAVPRKQAGKLRDIEKEMVAAENNAKKKGTTEAEAQLKTLKLDREVGEIAVEANEIDRLKQNALPKFSTAYKNKAKAAKAHAAQASSADQKAKTKKVEQAREARSLALKIEHEKTRMALMEAKAKAKGFPVRDAS